MQINAANKVDSDCHLLENIECPVNYLTLTNK